MFNEMNSFELIKTEEYDVSTHAVSKRSPTQHYFELGNRTRAAKLSRLFA